MSKGKAKASKSKSKIDDRELLRQLGELFSARPEDVVRSLERFKRELAEAKEKLGEK